MLDDLKYIHQKDPEDTLGIARRQAAQLGTAFELSGVAFSEIHNVIVMGMGGSALSAEFIRTWPGVNVPFEIVRNYDMPAYVSEHTLCIASSYSGNTEEILSALAQAEERGAQIAVTASGGKLQEVAAAKGFPFALIPNAEQPRYAVFAMLRAMITFLSLANVLKQKEFAADLAQVQQYLEQAVAAWGPEVPTSRNPAKQLAQELLGKSVVVYAGPKMYPAAYKWKISVNENAKQVAWVNQLPEFNHNEFLGWSVAPPVKPYAVVDLRSNLEHPRVQKRFEVTARMLSGLRPEPHVVQAEGQTELEQLLWLVTFGDFVTLYLGILNGIDPAPVALVEKFKKEMDR